MGNALGLLATEVITLTAQEILKHTLLSALLSALAWPMALTRLGYLIDNPWSVALDRAKLAGLVLADSLLMRSYLGFRPVTLVSGRASMFAYLNHPLFSVLKVSCCSTLGWV